ncbi:NUDIX hydrolase [candidate division KSB1 bacterium]|nr:NUDIX hydrolase [candidate division KSB1 bacterium]
MIIRVCGVVIRHQKVLMVHHRHNGREYWTLPGGAVELNETPEEAVVREIKEETGLNVAVMRPLFDEDFNGNKNACRCFLVKETKSNQEAYLGHDPEQSDLPVDERMLRGVAWHSFEKMKDDIQVSQVIEILGIAIKDA